ncbi:MAG: YfhO family protein [Streptococcaceae bacterium]|jgi:uncharacterized membrane protein YfhO|nr:YfhO family protein [Streptococcaceae bacterium]
MKCNFFKTKVFFWLKGKGKWYLLSFLFPVLIAGICYYNLGIYLKSARSIMASDSFSQFSNFHASFNNVLHGKQNFLYTWNASLGLNFLTLVSYYLGGIFTPIVFFFDNQNIPDALYLITLLKIGSAGFAFYLFAKNRFSLYSPVLIAFSTSYALMSFVMAHSEIIMWLDAFIWLPLIILGIHRVLEKQKQGLLFVSYLFLFISNFYTGFMIGVFSFLYFCVQLFIHWSVYKVRIFAYLRTSILSGIASMVMILPMYMDLRENGEKLSKVESFFTEDVCIWSLPLKNFIGAYDTTKFHALPFVYIGLFPLIFMFFFFLSKKIAWSEKLGYGLLFCLLVASFYIDWLNLFWQGFHYPNMFLFRFSFLFSFLVIVLALKGFFVLDKAEFIKVVLILLGLILTFSITYIYNHRRVKFIGYSEIFLTLLFLLVYGVLLFLVLFYQKSRKQKLGLVFLLIISFEMAINTRSEFQGILKDWGYSSRSLYTKPYPDIYQLVEEANKQEKDSRFRLENLSSISANDGLNYGYSGISFFSSIRNRHSSSFLNKMGYKSAGTNLNIRYDNNTLLMDSLLGVKYNIDKNNPMKYGFTKQKTVGDYHLYKNDNALNLAFKTNKEIYKSPVINNDNLLNQRLFFNTLSQRNEHYFMFAQPELVNQKDVEIVNNQSTITYKETMSDVAKTVTYKVKVPARKQSYFSFFVTNPAEAGASSASIMVNGQNHHSEVGITGQYINLGYHAIDEEVTFTVSLYGSAKVTILKPRILLLDTQAFQRSVDQLKIKGVNFKGNGRQIIGSTVANNQEKVLYATIPYDKGWKAWVNGKQVKIRPTQNAFITLPLVKGKNTIKLSFFPQGLKTGIVLFISGITFFMVSEYFIKKSKNVSKIFLL